MKKYQAIFFDLDGTLIHMPQDLFERECIKSEARHLARLFGMEKPLFAELLNRGVGAMVNNDGSKRNEDVFFDVFCPHTQVSREEAVRIFNRYYENEFGELRAVTVPNPGARDMVAEARRLSERVILSTLPVFPASAQRTRLGFIGLTPEDFDLVTDFSNCRCSKPNPAFFRSLLTEYRLDPARCLAVGNDLRDDVYAACGAGIPAVLLTDYGILREGFDALPHKEFSFDDFLRKLRDMNNE